MQNDHPGVGDDELTDETLVQRIECGDRDAFRLFYDRYCDLVYSISLRVCGQSLDAEAVVATVFWQFWEKPQRWNPQRGSVRTYLALTTRSRTRDQMRSEHRRSDRHLQSQEELAVHKLQLQTKLGPAEMLTRKDSRMEVRQACEQLADEVRESLELVFLEGFTQVEAAERLGLPLGTLKTRVRRGLGLLRQSLSETTDDWPIA